MISKIKTQKYLNDILKANKNIDKKQANELLKVKYEVGTVTFYDEQIMEIDEHFEQLWNSLTN